MKKLILLFFLISILIPVLSFAQTVQEAWVARYNGPANNVDKANAIAVDDYGNVYITGESKGSGGYLDYATIKYDPNGNQLWVTRYNGPGNRDDRAVAIAIDDDGNVYVTGESKGNGSSYDYATIKYNSVGVQQWVARYNGPKNSDDRAHGIAVDGSGNVYVTGESKGDGTYLDYATIKYNASGNQLWVKRYNGPVNYNDIAYAIAVDNNGNTYVTGESKGSSTCLDYVTIKYDINGNQIWVKRSNNSANSDDSAYAIALDGSGNVFVTGKSKTSNGHYDYATIKYNASGNQLWVRFYNGTGNEDDIAHAIAVDSSGNVYVTGESKGQGTYNDYATIKYDTNGNMLWVTRYNSPGNDDDIAHAIAVDSSGNVYVTGESEANEADEEDYATIKYDNNGNLLWTVRYNGPGTDYDRAYAIALGSSGNVCVTGESKGNGTELDYATICYAEASAGISVSPLSHNFGNVNVGSPSTAQTFTISNTGTANLVISAIAMTGSDAGMFSAATGGPSPCASLTPTITPGGSCTITATFTPASAGGKSTNLSITSNAPSTPTLAALSGTGLGVAGISVSPLSHNFGNVNVGSPSTAQTFTISNTGTANLVISAIAMTGSDAGMFSAATGGPSPCASLTPTITPGGSCTITATFTPASAGGKSTNLSFTSNAPSTPTLAALSGTGLGVAGISVSPLSHNFGNVNVGSPSTAQTFTISNTGTANLVISAIAMTGSDAGMFSAATGGPSPCASLTPTITPGGSCTITATFTPASAGGKSTNLSFTSNAPSTPTLAALSGTGLGVAGISVSPLSHNFGNVNVGSPSTAQTFTISNTGTANLVISAIAMTGSDAGMFSAATGGPSPCASLTPTITPGGSCTITATFTPASAGGKSTNLSFTSNAPSTPTLAALSGTGTVAGISVSPTSHNFGPVNVSSPSTAQTFTISNTGTANLVISAIAMTGSDAGMFSAATGGPSPCASLTPTITPGGSCTITATFTPASAGGKSTNLSFTSNAPTVNVPLSGTGTVAGISVSPTSHDFGSVNVGSPSTAQTFTISNTGTANLVISAIAMTGGDAGMFSAATGGPSPCASLTPTITPGGSCTITATFTPASAGGKSTNLSITSNAPTVNVPLSGTGTVAGISVSPSSHDFGSVNVGSPSTAQTFTISNTGTANLVISAIAMTGGDAGMFSAATGGPSPCASLTPTITPGGSCTITATFTPASSGGKSTNLSITSNAPTVNVPLSGTGTVAGISVSPSSHDFGSVNVGSPSTAQTFTISNTGTANLVISAIAMTGGDAGMFSAATGGPSPCASLTPTITPGGSCTITATFTPASAGGKSTNLSITSNAPSTPTLVALSGTGLGVAGISVSPLSHNFGNVNVGSPSTAQTFTISNTGTANLVISAIAMTGGDTGMFSAATGGPSPCASLTPTITPGGSCTITATFTPASAGGKSTNLSITSNAPSTPTLVALSGTGLGVAGISVSPSSHDFGSVNVGSPSTAQTFTISNTGTANLVISAIAMTGGDAGMFSAATGGPSPCASLTPTITPGGSCTITATFTPASAGGKSTNLSFTSNAPSTPTLVPLSGTGVTVAVPDIGPIASIDFGIVNVGSCVDRTTTIYNDGTATLTINSITRSSGSTEFTYIGPTTPFTISAGGSKTVTVRYCPTSGSSAVFNVNSNDPDESDVTFSVTGTESVACTIYVPQDYPTIQQAINAASDGCTILVSSGTYGENINFNGKAIKVKAAGSSGACGCQQEGNSKVTINGGYAGSVVTFNTGETRDSILEGFTLEFGFAPEGGGIFIEDASPTIKDCYINSNSAYDIGAMGYGGGIFISGSTASPLIFNNLIVSNMAKTSTGLSHGGGIYVANGASPAIQNCTISGNESNSPGGGGIYVSNGSSPVITDSIIWDNAPGNLYCETGCSMSVTYSDVGEAIAGIGNISTDPLFVGGAIGSYYLSHIRAGQGTDSPCIDSGSTLALDLGLDTSNTANDGIPDRGRVDMGYHYIPMPIFIQNAWTDPGNTFNPGETITFNVTYRVEGDPESMYQVTIKLLYQRDSNPSTRQSFTKVETRSPGLYTTQLQKTVPPTVVPGFFQIGYLATVQKVGGPPEILGKDLWLSGVTIQ